MSAPADTHTMQEMPQWVFDLEDARPVSLPAKPPSYLKHHRAILLRRFADRGAVAIADIELLELILYRALPRADVRALAETLIRQFGDFNRVLSAPVSQLVKVDGIDDITAHDIKLIEASAHRLARARVIQRPVISSWNAVLDYCHTTMGHLETEQFRVLFLDRKNTLLTDMTLSDGTVDQVPVYPREIVKRALELNASALLLVHNHPSGDPTPSQADIEMTQKIKAAGQTIGIALHDHIIIGKSCEISLRSEGHI